MTVTEANRRHLEELLAAQGRQGKVVRIYDAVDMTPEHVDTGGPGCSSRLTIRPRSPTPSNCC